MFNCLFSTMYYGHKTLQMVYLVHVYMGNILPFKCESQLQQTTFWSFCLFFFRENKAWHLVCLAHLNLEWNIKSFFSGLNMKKITFHVAYLLQYCDALIPLFLNHFTVIVWMSKNAGWVALYSIWSVSTLFALACWILRIKNICMYIVVSVEI